MHQSHDQGYFTPETYVQAQLLAEERQHGDPEAMRLLDALLANARHGELLEAQYCARMTQLEADALQELQLSSRSA